MTTTSLDTILDLAHARARAVREVDATLGAFHGLGLNDLALLLELAAAPQRRLRRVELAERLAVTTSGVARQLAPLERIGLVGRQPSPGDARLALVTLTDTGQRVVDEAVPTAEDAADRALGKLWSGDERERVASLLARTRV
jgi:DNA-binding MarR family transcriptional regulator